MNRRALQSVPPRAGLRCKASWVDPPYLVRHPELIPPMLDAFAPLWCLLCMPMLFFLTSLAWRFRLALMTLLVFMATGCASLTLADLQARNPQAYAGLCISSSGDRSPAAIAR